MCKSFRKHTNPSNFCSHCFFFVLNKLNVLVVTIENSTCSQHCFLWFWKPGPTPVRMVFFLFYWTPHICWYNRKKEKPFEQAYEQGKWLRQLGLVWFTLPVPKPVRMVFFLFYWNTHICWYNRKKRQPFEQAFKHGKWLRQLGLVWFTLSFFSIEIHTHVDTVERKEHNSSRRLKRESD